jgi:hypothetical protein
MLIFGIVTRGSNILGEYGTTHEEFGPQLVGIISRNKNPDTRLVPMGNRLCAVMNKNVNGELISFAVVIESLEERDISFNFLDALAAFFEKESTNPRMKAEMNSFISRQTKILMEKMNSQVSSTRDKLAEMNDSLNRTSEIAKGSISNFTLPRPTCGQQSQD